VISSRHEVLAIPCDPSAFDSHSQQGMSFGEVQSQPTQLTSLSSGSASALNLSINPEGTRDPLPLRSSARVRDGDPCSSRSRIATTVGTFEADAPSCTIECLTVRGSCTIECLTVRGSCLGPTTTSGIEIAAYSIFLALRPKPNVNDKIWLAGSPAIRRRDMLLQVQKAKHRVRGNGIQGPVRL